jgi:hypothetical protein
VFADTLLQGRILTDSGANLTHKFVEGAYTGVVQRRRLDAPSLGWSFATVRTNRTAAPRHAVIWKVPHKARVTIQVPFTGDLLKKCCNRKLILARAPAVISSAERTRCHEAVSESLISCPP